MSDFARKLQRRREVERRQKQDPKRFVINNPEEARIVVETVPEGRVGIWDQLEVFALTVEFTSSDGRRQNWQVVGLPERWETNDAEEDHDAAGHAGHG